MGKALYRQYRSVSFDEVIGQDHITTTLKNSLKNDSVAHAYLLTGPRGVGKTSIARILAHAVNGLEYTQDATHLDIIEIDAASNRRIDEIRELRERAQIAPVAAKYKVYIIDEVHMLTREAFNALLKTLEEPPAHVIFILATTDIHKLPDTIVSRCITFTFRPIDTASLVKHLKHIAKSEKVDINDDALKLLAEHGDGSFRDSISLLDQVKSIGGKIKLEDVELVLGIAGSEVINNIMVAISGGDAKELDKQLLSAYSHGASELKLSKQIAAYTRERLINYDFTLNARDATELLKDLLDVPASPRPRERLELCLLNQLFKNSVAATAPKPQIQHPPTQEEPEQQETVIVVEPELVPTKKNVARANSTGSIKIDDELWESVLQKLKTQNNTLYSVARMAQTELQTNKLSLSFKFPFHFKQVNQAKNKSLLTLIMDELGHKNLQIEILLTEDGKPVISSKVPAKDKEITNINNIFGEGEVLES